MQCKLLWIKASAKCINVNVNKLPQISEIVWTYIVVYVTALAPIDLLGYFKSGIGL